MAIRRITARWTGFTGAPGYSVFHFAEGGNVPDAGTARTRVKAFFDAVAAILPADVSIQVDPSVQVLDEATGVMTDIEDDDTNITPTNGIGGSGYSAPSGAVINWRSQAVVNGRLVRGRTFLVPLAGASYEADGTLTSVAIGRLRDAGNEMVTGDFANAFGIWSRPRAGAGGSFHTANSFNIPDKAAVLRSRRD